MLAHHFVTIALVMGSYWANYTRVGTVILVLMDFCDIWLPVSRLSEDVRYITCDNKLTLISSRVLIAGQAISVSPSSHLDRSDIRRLPHLLAYHPPNRFLPRHPLLHLPGPAYSALGLASGKGPIRQRLGDQRVPGAVDRALDHELYLVLDGL